MKIKTRHRILLSGGLTLVLLLLLTLIALFTKNTAVYETNFESGMGSFSRAGSTQLEHTSEYSFSGDYSLKASGASMDWHGARVPGSKSGISLDGDYRISAMLYSDTEIQMVMQITLKKSDGTKEYKWLDNQILHPGEWAKYTADISLSPSGYTGIDNISFENKTAPFSAAYYLDDVEFIKLTKITPFYTVMIVLLSILTVISFIVWCSSMLSRAKKDALTGVYSRDIIENDLPLLVSKAVSARKDTTLIMADIDHFKKVNDTYGHAAGDIVLKNFSDIISQCIRRRDWISRYGGEEFLIFLPDTNEDEGRTVAERIRTHLEKTSITVDEKEIRITASFGVASLLEHDLKTAKDLIKLADQNLYTAKNSGRNRVC